jgi:hypothetical protein
MLLLASTFGLAMMPNAEEPAADLVKSMVRLFLKGLAP